MFGTVESTKILTPIDVYVNTYTEGQCLVLCQCYYYVVGIFFSVIHMSNKFLVVSVR